MTPLLPLLLLGALSGNPGGQTPAPTTQPAPQPAPAQPAAPRPRPAQPTATATLTITISDGGGLPVQGVEVTASGPLDREGTSLASGLVRFLNLRSGEYRLRFAHPKYVLLERDVAMRPGAPQSIDVTLSPAPAAEAPVQQAPPAPSTTAANNAPPGEPATVAIPDFIERHFIGGRDATKEDPLGCTASAKTTLVQVRDPLPERALADSDEVIVVVYGEGSLRLGNRDVALSAKTLSLAVIPRGTVRGITRKGRNPLIFVSVLSGPPCTH